MVIITAPLKCYQKHVINTRNHVPIVVANASFEIRDCRKGLKIALGMHDRVTKKQGKIDIYNISAIHRHPDYINSGKLGFPNDLAIIELERDVDMNNSFVHPINLAASDNHSYVGETCYITGWGRMAGRDGGPLPDVLQEARIDVLEQRECVALWDQEVINDGHICVMERGEMGIGGCNGDSGGPLVCQRGGLWYLVGVASWVRTGCLPKWPTVYVRVSVYNDWIRQEATSIV